MNRLLPLVVALPTGCGPETTGDQAGTGTDDPGTTTGVSGEGTTTGEGRCTDGIVQGPVLVRTPEDAAALAGCTEVAGDLYVDPCRRCREPEPACWMCEDSDVLADLSDLGALERVGGHLIVGWDDPNTHHDGCVGHQRLDTLAGLTSLQTVGGDLLVGCSPELSSVDLPALEQVGGMMEIQGTTPAALELPALEEVGSMSLHGEARTDLRFPALRAVAGDLFLYDTTIGSLDHVPSLMSVAGRVTVIRNDLLQDLGAVQTASIAGVEARLVPALEEVVLLQPTPQLTQGIQVESATALVRISVPPSVETVAYMLLLGNDALTELDLPSVSTISGLDVMNNESLATLEGFSSLRQIDGDLRITGNPSLCQSLVDAFVAGLQVDGSVLAERNAEC